MKSVLYIDDSEKKKNENENIHNVHNLNID